MREVVLDTETTGLDPNEHRIVEIGCVELVNRLPTGMTVHAYFNPQRRMPKDAEAIHGLTEEFLRDKPLFADRANALTLFLDGAMLVAHNAAFDVGFLNMELERAGLPKIDSSLVIDTMALAQRKHPGRNSLDDLRKRYKIKHIKRDKHGALIDAQILAECYLEMLGDKQGMFDFDEVQIEAAIEAMPTRPRPIPLPPRLTADCIKAHRAFIMNDKKLKATAIWLDYWEPERMAA